MVYYALRWELLLVLYAYGPNNLFIITFYCLLLDSESLIKISESKGK